MKSFKIAIITGAIAVAAVIATIIIVSTGNSGYGLYVSAVSGDVNISNTSEGTSEAAAIDTFLSTGDVITVNEGASCTLIYRTRDNFDENYIVLEPSTQVFVTGDFNGKSDSELYLNRGSMISSAIEKSKYNVTVRTENSSCTTDGAALRIAYTIGEANSTSVASFGGAAAIQLFDSLGNAVDKDGNASETPELLGNGLSGKIVSGSPFPKFEYLNIPTVLSDYSASTLRELLTAAAFHDLAFTAADIKAAYDNAPSAPVTDLPDSEQTTASEAVTTTVPSETEITEETTTVPESSETTVTTTTTAPITTTAATTTRPPETTTAPQTTTTAAPTTTKAPVTTTAATEEKTISVYIIIEDEIYVQEVPYGGSAEKPADPVIEGKKFVQWDNSFDNITSERTITAVFEDVGGAQTTASETEITFPAASKSHTVTVNINGNISTQTVADGGSAVLPNVNVPGYVFLGWDRSPDNITGDVTITAMLVPDTSSGGQSGSSNVYTVTFIVDGIPYPVSVAAGESAVPPVIPTTNSAGQTFIGWDNYFQNVNSDITVTAIFGSIS